MGASTQTLPKMSRKGERVIEGIKRMVSDFVDDQSLNPLDGVPGGIRYPLSPVHWGIISRLSRTQKALLQCFKDKRTTYFDIMQVMGMEAPNISVELKLLKQPLDDSGKPSPSHALIRDTDETVIREVPKGRVEGTYPTAVKVFKLTQFGRYVRRYHCLVPDELVKDIVELKKTNIAKDKQISDLRKKLKEKKK